MILVTREEMQWMDKQAIQKEGIPSLALMENAGRAIADYIIRMQQAAALQISILCGPGNNGGDGLVVARILHESKISIKVFLAAPEESYRGDALINLRRLPLPFIPLHTQRLLKIYYDEIASSPFILDALFGTGLSRPLTDYFAYLVAELNAMKVPILSVDIPSGLCATSGEKMGEAIYASETLSLHRPKLGLVKGPDCFLAGHIHVFPIGIPDAYDSKIKRKEFLITPEAFRSFLKARPRQSHKYKFGQALTIAGSRNKIGAALMTARAVLRSGAGLSTLALPEEAYQKIDPKFSEIMFEPFNLSSPESLSLLQRGKFKAVAIGPGMGVSGETKNFIFSLLPQVQTPLVLDADALNLIATDLSILKKIKAPVLLTPHTGEMQRLLEGLPPPNPLLIKEREYEEVLNFAKKFQVWVLLKGYRSVLATPSGELWFNSNGNPGMATAGAGDVLTGLLGGLLAQGLSMKVAAKAGIWIHGRAGDLVAEEKGEKGILAWDIAEKIPCVLKELLTSRQFI
ncbi:MAG: NAD(P)H-hydrate dehydratase [Deltaproteobacteria bacterium]|nr:NAD(P)H-hydrate dehydratase [Deltaproteobacteria bacterium]